MENLEFKIKLRDLQIKHHFEEMLFFQIWKDAGTTERETITLNLGKTQAKEIMDLINSQK